MKRLPLCALGLALGLGAPVSAQEPARSDDALLNPLARIDPAKLDGFLGRPLFSPTRRPPPPPPSEPPAETAAAPEAPPPGMRLVGIVRTPRESIAQLVQDEGGGRLSVRVGDFLADWTVAAIDASTVTLKLGDRETRLDIFRSGAGGVGDSQSRASEGPGLEGTSAGGFGNPPAAKPRKREWTKEEVEGFFGQ